MIASDAAWRRAAIYVGETGEAAGYLGRTHRKWCRAVQLGMGEIAIHWVPDKQRRLNLEKILRHAQRPPLNEQLTPPVPRRNALLDALTEALTPKPFTSNALAGPRRDPLIEALMAKPASVNALAGPPP